MVTVGTVGIASPPPMYPACEKSRMVSPFGVLAYASFPWRRPTPRARGPLPAEELRARRRSRRVACVARVAVACVGVPAARLPRRLPPAAKRLSPPCRHRRRRSCRRRTCRRRSVATGAGHEQRHGHRQQGRRDAARGDQEARFEASCIIEVFVFRGKVQAPPKQEPCQRHEAALATVRAADVVVLCS